MSIATGTRLGQYEVQDFIGQGAMGVVYRAYHAQLERTGAIKVMQAISPDADTVARFRHEAQAIAKLRHPNIVDVYDFGEWQGTPYMIVEYVPGGSLAGRMAHGTLDRATALRYLRGIAAGLDYAHAHGVVHRDVKPANVLLSEDDSPVIADFGLAKLLQGSSLKSMTGVTTGTPAYMSPEQVTGSKVGPASDRYSLATIAYEMLTGVIPFDGEALMEMLYAQVHREPLKPSSRYPDLGAAVDDVIMRGLAKDPTARWESCNAFVEALDAALAAPATAPAARSAVVAPPTLASTLPVAKPASVVKKPRPAMRTEVMPVPAAVGPTAPPEAARPKPQRWRQRAAIAAAALVLPAVVFGVCSAVTTTTLVLNPGTAARGQDVLVTANHVPSKQTGRIELHSDVRVFAFTADAGGQVKTYIRVPSDIALGDHTVSICWNASCHASATLRVVDGTGIVLPSGSLTPGPSPSPSHSPTPGSTPQPTPPPPNPCPAESPVLTSPKGTLVAPTTITVSGSGYTPNKSVSVSWSLSGKPEGTKTTTVSPSGTFAVTFSVPALSIGNGVATATDSCGRSATTSFTIA